MTFAELKTELIARGFDYLTPAQPGYYLNRAYHRFCDREAWPFLEATTSGAGTVTITDLRAVLSVRDTTADGVLAYEDIRNLYDADPGLDDTGTPAFWYLSSETEIATWPASSSTIAVRYIKSPADLATDGSEPVLPDRYHYAIVDGACALAYRDSDNFEAAQSCEDAFEVAIQECADSTLAPNYDNPLSINASGSTDW